MKIRGAKFVLWSLATLAGLTGLAVALVLFTPLPDAVAQRMLARALRETGGTLTVRERQGSLAKGLDWYGVSLESPRRFSFRAERIHLRLRTVPLLAGVLSVAELSLDRPDLRLAPDSEKSDASGPTAWPPKDLPLIMVSRAQIHDGRVTMPFRIEGAGEGPTVVSGLEGSLSLTLAGSRLSIADLRINCQAPPPLPARLQTEGDLSMEFGGKCSFRLSLASPRSHLFAAGSYSPGREGGLCTARLRFEPVALREIAFAWPGSPDLLLSGGGQATFWHSSVRWAMDLKDPAMGPLKTSGSLGFGDGDLKLSADLTTPGASLAPFVTTPPGKEFRVSGSGSVEAEYSRASGLTWRTDARLGPSKAWGVALTSAEVRASGRGLRVDAGGVVGSAPAGPLHFSLAWDGSSRTLRLQGSCESVDPLRLMTDLGRPLTLPASLHVPEGRWSVPAFTADYAGSLLSVSGTTEGPAGGTVTFEGGPFGPGHATVWTAKLRSLDPGAWGARERGRVDADLAFSGATFTSGELRCDLLAAEWAGLRVEPMQASVTFSPGAFSLAPLTLRTSAGVVSGRWAQAGGRGEGQATFDLQDLGVLGPLVSLPTLKGRLKGVVTQHPSDRVSLSGEATGTGVAWGGMSAKTLQLKGRWTGGSDGLDGSAECTALKHGDTLLGDAALEAVGRLEAFRFEAKATVREKMRLTASGRGAVRADGGGHLDLGALALVLPRRTLVQEGPAALDWSPRHLALSGLDLRGKQSRLQASGRMGFGEGGPSPAISGHLVANHMGFAVNSPPPNDYVVKGVVDADLSWGGTIALPSLAGQVRLTDGYYRWPDSDLAIAPVTLTLEARGDQLVLTEGRALCAPGGEATATGHLAFRGFLPGKMRLEAVGKSFPLVMGRDMEATTDFRLTLAGTLAAPVVEGAVTVLKGRIQMPDLARQQALPTTIHFVNAPEGSPFRPEEEGPEVMGPFRGAVTVTSKGGLWISNRNLMAELAGSLEARLTAKGTELEGSLTVLDGRYIFQNRKFELQESRISFDGSTDLDPLLDVSALYRAPGADVFVHLTGTARRPSVAFSSVPPMPQEDILATILFGRPYKDLSAGEKESWSSAVTVMAAQYKASGLLGAVQSSLGLETLSVAASSTGVTEMGFSKYINDRTVLEYRQVFGNLPETHVNLRYRINNQWSIQTEASTTSKAGVDVLWEHRY